MNRTERLMSGIKFESRPDKKLDGFGRFCGFNCGQGNSQGYRWELNEQVSDVADLLPLDPFDMDNEATAGLIEGSLKDLGLNSLGFETNEIGVGKSDNRLFAGFNFVWNPEMGAENVNDKSATCAMEFWNGPFNSHLLLDGTMEEEELMGFHCEKYFFYNDAVNKHQGCTEGNIEVAGAPPAEGLFLALTYLRSEDLLSVEMVCKSLRDAVLNDPLLWRRIHIDPSLSDKITDDALLQLTNRARGNLNYLSLVDCLKISENGLKHVLERNRRLTKLSVAGCVNLRFDGLLSILKAIKSAGSLGIKRLRIGGLSDITNERFEELKMLLGVNNSKLPTSCKLRFYRGDHSYLSLDDDSAIDIETCPGCQNPRQVYDCPSVSCQRMQHGNQLCRACILCIPRCMSCGCCLSSCEYEETFFLENLCFNCVFLSFGQPASCHIFLCG